MDQDTRNKLQRATQQVRKILEEEFAEQLEGTFDVLPDGKILPEPGKHLDARQRLTRQKLAAAIEHIKASGKTPQEAVGEYTREAAFTFLNRFVALLMLEARGLLQECVSKGDASSGFKEFCGLAPGLSSLDDGGYRLYLECLFDELTVEVKVLFDRRDSASLLWPRRGALTELLEILSQTDLAGVWSEDETIGWVYQYFNSGEERKKMREESQAPRNSRELAVRNQFFTPRYVVEFLTDNTLGRIWYEMQKSDTRLVDECEYLVRRPSEVFLNEGQKPSTDDSDAEQDMSQEELLKKTVYIPHRAKKDPRDLKILDPACGSGHFLLYAFDLLVSIYDEAWHDDANVPSEVTKKRLREDYPDLTRLHAALPGLVIAHNLHGIDIDTRAAQIAALALWMRGQRAFSDSGVSRDRRPPTQKSNIVCAEPMPGEAAFLDEFIAEHLSADAECRLLASLVRKVFEAMALAGEAGSLLKIEVEIAEEVAKAKEQWLERPEYKQQSLFDDEPRTVQQELDLTHGITDEYFWEEAEQRIYDALAHYAEHQLEPSAFRKRLFAKDAATGFAFVDVCRKEYDVVLMNPPFGSATADFGRGLKDSFPLTYVDLYACFIARGLELTPYGKLGAITSRNYLATKKLAKWREKSLISRLEILVDFGLGVMDDAMVQSCGAIFSASANVTSIVFFDLRQNEDKEAAIERIRQATVGCRFVVPRERFLALPGTRFLYTIPDEVHRLLCLQSRFEPLVGTAREGMRTFDNFRFVRLRWEVCSGDIGPDAVWEPLSKGGEFAFFYADFPLVVKWNQTGSELAAVNISVNGQVAQSRQASSYYRVSGNTYSERSAKGFSARLLPAGCIISQVGPTIISEAVAPELVLGWLNSRAVRYLIELQASFYHYNSGIIKRLPWVDWPNDARDRVIHSVRTAVAAIRDIAIRDETNSNYVGPIVSGSLEENGKVLASMIANAEACTAEALTLVDGEVDNVYGVDSRTWERDHSEDDESPQQEDRGNDLGHGDRRHNAALDMISFAFGCLLGRWHVSNARETPISRVSMPSDPLPVCAPASLFSTAAGTSTHAEFHNFLVHDSGHFSSATERILDTIDFMLTPDKTNVRVSIPEAVGTSSENFGTWFNENFFRNHIGQYSQFRRKAPIYWQIATPSSSYSVWCYYHHFTRDTFFQVRNEYVIPKLNHERQKLDRIRGEAGAEPTRSQRKEIEDQEKFVTELRAMSEEVERIAPLWNPNRNDGVIINFAPLWRLVPQNKSWQKECKKVWDKLVNGEYDWAHLTMQLWPERVVPKCVTDASLALAHGLEEVFWEQDDRDRFQPKGEPQGGWEPVIKELVSERTSPAVKAALESLLTAPTPAGNSKSRRRKATT